MNEIKEGDKVGAFNELEKVWMIGTVREIQPHKIIVGHVGWAGELPWPYKPENVMLLSKLQEEGYTVVPEWEGTQVSEEERANIKEIMKTALCITPMNILKEGKDKNSGYYTYCIQYDGGTGGKQYYINIRRRGKRLECPSIHELNIEGWNGFEPRLKYIGDGRRRTSLYKHLIDGAKRYIELYRPSE